jgi:hypothetical protein
MIKLKNFLLVFFHIVLITHAYSQNISLNNIGSLTNILNESSGITFIAPNRLYTHDDSSGNNEIYEIDTLGNLIRTININNANNTDWEDITKDNLNNIYIGNFGNNDNDRTNLKISPAQNNLDLAKGILLLPCLSNKNEMFIIFNRKIIFEADSDQTSDIKSESSSSIISSSVCVLSIVSSTILLTSDINSLSVNLIFPIIFFLINIITMPIHLQFSD